MGRDEDDDDSQDLDDRTRRHYHVLAQYLHEHQLLETLAMLETETGVTYTDGALPIASVLETSLDMFDRYNVGPGGDAEDTEQQLSEIERGVCCTGPAEAGPSGSFSSNITAVCWAATRFDEFVALAASVDRTVRVLGGGGQILAELNGLPTPVLGLHVSPLSADAVAAAGGQEVLATAMGGEASILWVRRPLETPCMGESDASRWALESRQRFTDHTKHTTSGRFAPPSKESCSSSHFVTVSRDHHAKVYVRDQDSGAFGLAGSAKFTGEVTCCCWVSDRTFAFAVREECHLYYWDVDGGSDEGGPRERLKTNLNALGDQIVSFAVLALAVSPDRSLIAVCTDKSRVILLKTFGDRQLRNLYGAIIDEYDMPSVCFSLDGSFVYATSTITLRAAALRRGEGEEPSARAAVAGGAGEIAIFEVRTGELALRLSCHEKSVRCADRHPHSEMLVTGSFDKTVKCWG